MHKVSKLQCQAALSLDLPYTYFNNTHLVRIELGRRHYFFHSGHTSFNNAADSEKASNKFDMNQQLSQANFPVPRAITLFREDMTQNGLNRIDLHFPVVIKPTINTEGGGKDVTCNINSIEQLSAIARRLFESHNQLSIEEFLRYPKAYRVLIFFNKVIGVVERIPAHVTGDGIHSIEQLINKDNEIRKTQAQAVSMGAITVDDECHIKLKELNLTLDSIPQKDQQITLCYGCNSSRGGTMTSLKDAICRDNADLLCSAAEELNLNIVGFDVICHDMMSPISDTGGAIIEANVNPDTTIHEHPLAGIPRPVNRIIMKKIIQQHPILYWRYRSNSRSSTIIRYAKIAIVLVLATILFAISPMSILKKTPSPPHESHALQKQNPLNPRHRSQSPPPRLHHT